MAAAIPGVASRTAESVSVGVVNLGRGATSVVWSAGRTAEAIAGLPFLLYRVGVALVDVSARPVRAAQLAGAAASAAVEGLSRGAVGIGERIGVTVAIPGKVAQGVLAGASALGHAADSTNKTVGGAVQTVGQAADAIGQAEIPERTLKTARSVFVGAFMIGRRPADNREPGAALRSGPLVDDEDF